MKHEHVFRQSWLGTYWECPEQARAILVGEYPYDETEAAAKGTAGHAAIEAIIERCASFDEAMDVAVTTFRELSAHPEFRWVQVRKESTCIKHIAAGLTSWWKYVKPTLGASIWCEQKFKFIFSEDDERVIWLSGTADFADSNGLRDWKFSGNEDKYSRDKWKLQRYGVQPSVYACAARELGLYGPDEDVPFKYVNLLPKGGKPQIVPTVRTSADARWLEQQLVSVARQIEHGTELTWPLRDQSALCSAKWCLKWDTCKGKYTNTGDNE